MFYEDDLPSILKDFGETAILEGGGEVTVIFDNEFAAAVPIDAEIETASPKAYGRTSDLEDLAHDDTIEIRGTTYYVKGIHPDGTGMTTLILAKT
jgi:hypothetical protein